MLLTCAIVADFIKKIISYDRFDIKGLINFIDKFLTHVTQDKKTSHGEPACRQAGKAQVK